MSGEAQKRCNKCNEPMVTKGCRPCQRKAAAEHRKTKEYKDYIKKINPARYQKHKAKYAARAYIRNHLRYGKITKPDICSRCKKLIRVEAHHEDYSKPLEVAWLCNICHKIIHGRIVDEQLLAEFQEVNVNNGRLYV